MATDFREFISDEIIRIERPGRRATFEASIAASRFGPLNELQLLYEGEEPEIAEAPLDERSSFKLNYIRWLDDSEYDSLPEMMRAHESYQSIVARGERVLPFIASELRKDPSFIFLALEDITGKNPVPPNAVGNLQATTDAWLAWLQS